MAATGMMGLWTKTISGKMFTATADGLTYDGDDPLDREMNAGAAMLRGFYASFGKDDHKIQKIECDVKDVQFLADPDKVTYKVKLNLEDDGGNTPSADDSWVSLLFISEAKSGTNGKLHYIPAWATCDEEGKFEAWAKFDVTTMKSPAPQAALVRWDVSFGEYEHEGHTHLGRHYVKSLEVSISGVDRVTDTDIKVTGKVRMEDDSGNNSKVAFVELTVFAIC